MDVSIIIVNWNTREILSDCLRSVYEQTSNIDFEVIVVDNKSSDGSVNMVKNNFPWVLLLENNINRGFAAANNQGIEISKGRYVLLLNSDTVVLDKAIEKTIAFAEVHPKAAVVGCKVLNPDRSLQSSCFMLPSILNLTLWVTYLYKLFPKSSFFGRERMNWWDRDSVMDVDVITGCFMLVRREAIEQVGTMDEQFFMYFEETDWCYRFKQAGWMNVFMPEAEIIHLGGASSRQVRIKTVNQWRKSMLLFYKKHKSFLAYITAWILITLFFLTRVPYWWFKRILTKYVVNKQ